MPPEPMLLDQSGDKLSRTPGAFCGARYTAQGTEAAELVEC